MIARGLSGVDFVCANTDTQALRRSTARTQLQLGSTLTRGLGAGARPESGATAMEDRDRIAGMIDGADMLFITAGMGGGTGTGTCARHRGYRRPRHPDRRRRDAALQVRRQAAARIASAEHRGADEGRFADRHSERQADGRPGRGLAVLDAYAAANDVLHGAVSGIAEVINNPGLVNVDFADVRTVMSEVGMAMMGSAMAGGADPRARGGAAGGEEPAARGRESRRSARRARQHHRIVGLKMKEYHEVMNTIKEFTAEDAMVIVGTVIEAMEDRLRVTMIATGLGGAVVATRRPPKRIEVLETVVERTGTDNVGMRVAETIDYEKLDQPAVARRRHTASVAAPAFDPSEIPFLRKQAD